MTEHTSDTTEKKLEKRVEMSVETRIRLGEIEEENYSPATEDDVYGRQVNFSEVEDPKYDHY